MDPFPPTQQPSIEDQTRRFLERKCVEEACRRWWEIKRPDGSRIATCTWDEFAATGHHAVEDYRIRMAAALGYSQ